MPNEFLENLLKRWQTGELNIGHLENELRSLLAATSMGTDVQVDMDRQRRCGYSEVVFAPGKSPDTIGKVFRIQQAAGQNSLATRVSSEQSELIQREFPGAIYNPAAKTLTASAPADRSLAHRSTVA